jgi:hypothetical protein
VSERESEEEALQALCTRSLPSARDLALGKVFFNFKIHFAECQISGTRQSCLCRVSPGRHSAKTLFPILQKFLCRVPNSGNSAKVSLPSVFSRHSAKCIFIFFYFVSQTFCSMFLHYVDLHVSFVDNYNRVFNR